MSRLTYYDFTDVPIGVFAQLQVSGGSVVPTTPSASTERFIGVINLYGGFYLPEDATIDYIFDPAQGFLVGLLRLAYGLTSNSPGAGIPFSFRLPQGFRYIERPFLMPPETSPHTIQYQSFRLRSDGLEFRLFAEPDIPSPYILFPQPFAIVRFPSIPRVELSMKHKDESCSC